MDLSPLVNANASELDPNMRVSRPETDEIVWHDPRKVPFRLLGFKWFEQDGLYRRLPVRPNHPIPAPLDALANHTAGGQIQFCTDSIKIFVRVNLIGNNPMYHMAQTGMCGFDLYLGGPFEQVFAGVSKFNWDAETYTVELASNPAGTMEQVTLNFPLYNGVKSVEVGLDKGSKVVGPAPLEDHRPIVIYGTSITQGGCATRPGMSYTNILSRYLNREVVNLGFSGNGKGEPELARLIGEIKNKAMVVLDFEANTHDLLRTLLKPFIEELRKLGKDTPILVISRIPMARDLNPIILAKRQELRDFQRDLVASMQEAGDQHLFFQDGKDLMNERWGQEATVDGTHCTDLGFFMMAEALAPVFKRILGVAK